MKFISEYQTLIAGLIAIVAAFITVRPVWRQIRYMRVQTSGVLREHLNDRLRVTLRQRKWLSEHLRDFEGELLRGIREAEESKSGIIDPQAAFNQDLVAGVLIDELKLYKDETLLAPAVEEGLDALIAELQKLKGTVEAIHLPHSMDQFGEDTVDAERWAEIEKAAHEADESICLMASAFSGSIETFLRTTASELKSLRMRLSEIDQELLKTRR